jgi:hypothetical protein
MSPVGATRGRYRRSYSSLLRPASPPERSKRSGLGHRRRARTGERPHYASLRPIRAATRCRQALSAAPYRLSSPCAHVDASGVGNLRGGGLGARRPPTNTEAGCRGRAGLGVLVLSSPGRGWLPVWLAALSVPPVVTGRAAAQDEQNEYDYRAREHERAGANRQGGPQGHGVLYFTSGPPSLPRPSALGCRRTSSLEQLGVPKLSPRSPPEGSRREARQRQASAF